MQKRPAEVGGVDRERPRVRAEAGRASEPPEPRHTRPLAWSWSGPLARPWTLVREGGPQRMRQATSFGARAAGRRRTRGVFCQPRSAGRAACPSCTASSAGEGCWRRRGLVALCRPHPKGPAPVERKRCLAAVGGEKAWRRLHSPGVGEGSMKDHTLTRSRGCGGWAQVEA